MNFSPFVVFDGDCEKAFVYYQSVFGGELSLMRYEDAPLMDKPEISMDDKVIYAELILGEQKLMGGDVADRLYQNQQGVLVAWQGDSEAEVERVFAALADGGLIRQALGYAFWTPKYGMLEDRFGTVWLISCKAQAPV